MFRACNTLAYFRSNGRQVGDRCDMVKFDAVLLNMA